MSTRTTYREMTERYKRPKKVYLIWAGACALVVCAYLLSGLPTLSSYVLWYRGNAAFNHGDYGQAGIYYLTALDGNQNSKRLNYNLANAYYAQGRYSEAIAIYKKALYKNDNAVAANAWNNLGNAYFITGNLKKSAEAYGRAVLLDSNAFARQNFVYVLGKLHDKEQQELVRQLKKRLDVNTDQGSKKNDTGSNNDKGEQDDSRQTPNISSKTVDELFGQIDKNEDKVRGRISRLKHKNDQAATALDY